MIDALQATQPETGQLLACSFINTPTSQEAADADKGERDHKQDERKRPIGILSCPRGLAEISCDESGDIYIRLEESFECEDIVGYLVAIEHQGNGQCFSDSAGEPQHNSGSQARGGGWNNCLAHHLPASRTQGQAGLA